MLSTEKRPEIRACFFVAALSLLARAPVAGQEAVGPVLSVSATMVASIESTGVRPITLGPSGGPAFQVPGAGRLIGFAPAEPPSPSSRGVAGAVRSRIELITPGAPGRPGLLRHTIAAVY